MRAVKCARYTALGQSSKKSCLLSTEIFLENSNGTVTTSILVPRILRNLFDICKETKASRMEQNILCDSALVNELSYKRLRLKIIFMHLQRGVKNGSSAIL